MEKDVEQNVNKAIIGNWSSKIYYFESVPPEICDFHIDSYQICKHWLEASTGRLLNKEDTQRYQRIVTVLKEIVRLMEEIKIALQADQLKKLGIFEKVRTIVAEKLGIEPDQVTPVVNFANDLGVESLDTVELVIALEEAFKIEIAEQSKTLLTIQQTINYINQKLEIAV